MNGDKKEVRMGIRVSEKTKKELQALADIEKRSLSDFIRIELEKIVSERKPQTQ